MLGHQRALNQGYLDFHHCLFTTHLQPRQLGEHTGPAPCWHGGLQSIWGSAAKAQPGHAAGAQPLLDH